MKKLRTRHAVLGLGSLIVLAALWLTDPDQGNATGMYMLALAVGITAVAVAHLARKALFDYPEADLQQLFRRAGEAPTGAGLALVAVAIVLYGLLGIFGRAQAATPPGVPPAALQHLPTLAAETARLWPDVPMAAYPAGLIEHESCITLKHPRCWSATSRLKSAREEGAGLGQLTRAWTQGGALRFDALADLRAQHPAELAGLSWANVYQRPDLQMRTHDEWDQAEDGKQLSPKEAAIAVAKSLGQTETAALFERADAVGVQGQLSVVLPLNRLERDCKHGKGWARLGKGDDVTWGVKTDGGYRVSRPGLWTVGGSDGFTRKKEDSYKVARVKLGELFWVIATAE